MISNKQLEKLTEVMRELHHGKWSWEETEPFADMKRSIWDLYSNRGEPIWDDEPAGIGNMQHGMKILRGDEDTFDSTGQAMRDFILLAHESLPAMILEIHTWRSAYTQMHNAMHGHGFRMETKEQAKERRVRALESLEKMAAEGGFDNEDHSDYVDLEDDAIKD